MKAGSPVRGTLQSSKKEKVVIGELESRLAG